MMPQQIQLTVEEGLAFQKFDARLQGFLEGTKTAIDHFKLMRVQEMVAARKTAQPDPAPAAE